MSDAHPYRSILVILTGILSLLPRASQAREMKGFGVLPLHFVENRGQLEPSVKFHDLGRSMLFTQEGVRVGSFALTGMSEDAELVASEPRRAQVSYFTGGGGEPAHVPTFGAVVYRHAYPGVDLVFYGRRGEVEYDLVIHPGADPSRARFEVTGVEHFELTAAGDLVLGLSGGEQVVQRRPLSYQVIDGRRVEVESRIQLDPASHPLALGFEVGSYDPSQPLIIDPVLSFSTYLGGLGAYEADGLALDSQGNLYLTGETSWDDAFVVKLNPTGRDLIYAAYLGGSGSDSGWKIAVDKSGSAYVVGWTGSVNFPVKNAYDTSLGGTDDAFVLKLNPAGNRIVYSTYLGGSSYDYGYGIAVDARGQAYVAGETTSADFPVESAYDPTPGGNYDAFVAKLSASGKVLLYSTYLGGSSYDGAYGIAIDSRGRAYVVGEADSSDFPTQSAHDNTLGGTYDAFVAKLSITGRSLIYSTFLGGGSGEWANDIAVDRKGRAYVTGGTGSADFPVVNAYDTTLGGTGDAFVTKLDRSGSELIYSTYLGGSSYEQARAIAVDKAGSAHVVGGTQSVNFPRKQALFEYSGNEDAFLTKLHPSGESLIYSTTLGGSLSDRGYGVAVDGQGRATVSGETRSEDFPTRKALYPIKWTEGGFYEAFVAQVLAGKRGSSSARAEEE